MEFQALLLHCQMVSLKTLDLTMIKFDTEPGETREGFLNLMESFYHEQDFWRRNNSRMQFLLFYKNYEDLKPKKKSKPKKQGLEVFCG